jgi:hypothetical protein
MKETQTIIVTPAGRKRYLEILFNHLSKQKKDFTVWQLWLNTENQEDIEFCKSLERHYDWIECYDLDVPFRGLKSIYTFFKYCINKDCVYIRLDDDVVYLEKGFIRKFATARKKNPVPFLMYANIVNNVLCDHIHQRIGALSLNPCPINYSVMDEIGWADPQVAKVKHDSFFENYYQNNIDSYKFNFFWRLKLHNVERCSINAISWLGERFAEFGGVVGEDEEQWLSVDKPVHDGSYNVIYGDALCVHYAFYTQRDFIDSQDYILKKYKTISLL